MIKPDWNIFKAKFSNNPQLHFEWLCYLLFCNEHGKKTGIFRYKNQSAIETDPIVVGSDVIGWQAKFYSTALSDHKDDILEMLTKSKRDYPNITKIVFYTNSEWGQNKGKDPSGKVEIEKEATNLSVTIEWRCGSYFESPFVVDENKKVCSHFFVESDNVLELLATLISHTDRLLGQISEDIDFDGKTVVIGRDKELANITATSNRAVVVSGEGGTGKTALIKSLYKNKPPVSAFYVFKASEFSVNKIEEILTGISFGDFLDAHDGVDEKLVVIDSAENLLSLKNTDPFREFITGLLVNSWKVWLTTRNNYLDDLAFQFIEVYKCGYEAINLSPLSQKELAELANKYNFDLPSDQRLINLISVPMYLKEYLRHYAENRALDYSGFKNSLWTRVILKNNPERERLFIDLCILRSNSGRFFIPIESTSFNQSVLESLIADGILGYESPHGYFVTHDLYEEWALDKRLESSFLVCETSAQFFNEVGKSLPVRRAFRKWLSDKLGDEDEEIIMFINEAFGSESIERIWLDEVIVALLLSNSPAFFFKYYKDRLLNEEFSLLKKVCLLIRIGCKEVNTDIFEKLGLRDINLLSMEYVLTRPKGGGWAALIQFISDNDSQILDKVINFILPVLNDWNSVNRTGETTRLSSLLALKYYEIMMENDIYFRDDDFTKNLLHTVTFGVKEIKLELSGVIDQVVGNKWRNHNELYNSLCSYILSKMECINVAQALPEKVIDLARLYWTHLPSEDEYFHSGIDIDHYFGVARGSDNFFPSSAYQTPMYSLLGASFYKSLDFIIEFSNFAAETYVSSSLGRSEYEVVSVCVGGNQFIDQYMCNRLWCLYRGTQVSPHVLESIIMALEKFLIERGKNTSNERLEKILLNILSRSNSAILTAVVVSIVTALPDKTFNVAKLLFQTKELFFYDTNRYVLDRTHKSQLVTLRESFGINRANELHENERISACDERHRRFRLEDIMLQYQLFRQEEISEEDSKTRSKEIWRILDVHYEQLPDKENETDYDKTWMLFLARMDRRKMSPEAKETEDGFYLELNPEIDDDLREYSEQALKKSNEPFKNSQLMVWANDRLYRRQNYQKFEGYEKDPLIALEEVKALWSELTSSSESVTAQFNRSLPSVVCTVLLRDFDDKLDVEGLQFCREIILAYATLFTKDSYRYQISDGVLPAVHVLPVLHKYFPEDRADIKVLIIFALMRTESVDLMGGTKFNSIVIHTLQSLWRNDYKTALVIYIGYLLLAKKKQEIFQEYRSSEFSHGNFQLDMSSFWKVFYEKTSDIFEKIDDGTISECVINDLDNYDVDILATAFQIAPLPSECFLEIPYVKSIIDIVSEKILSDDRDDKIDYVTKHSFLKWYTKFVLHLEIDKIADYLSPFIARFSAREGMADLLTEFISAVDQSGRTENFWAVWDLFRDKFISTVSINSSNYYSRKLVESFMFARNAWKDEATDWYVLTAERKVFFENLTVNIGCDEAYLYSLSKLLCGIGSSYLESGVLWLSSAIKGSDSSLSRDYRDNIIWYLEKAIRRYVFLNRDKARRNAKINAALLGILDYLIANESVVGYLLREDIA